MARFDGWRTICVGFDSGPPSIHETALVKNPELLGAGTQIWAYASVHAGVVMGQNCSLGERAYVGAYTTIGDRTRMGEKVHITDHMTIGSGVFMAPLVCFSNDKHPVVNNPFFKRDSPVVEDDVSIGIGAVILPGVRLGRGCLVGAGAVVTKDVAPHTTVVGNPARRLRSVEHDEVSCLQGL